MPNIFKLQEISLLLILSYSSIVSAEIKVEITGVSNNLEKEILDGLVITRQTANGSISDARVRTLYRRSLSELGTVLRANGYYDYKVIDSLEQLDANWETKFQIEPGDPIVIKEVTIDIQGDGSGDQSFANVLNDFPLKRSNLLNHRQYESGKIKLQTLARERGYFDAKFIKNIVTIKESEKTANIQLVYSTGIRYRYGDLVLEETVVGRERLDRLIPFTSGDFYDANHLITLSKNLRDSNYFNEVIVRPEIDELRDHMVPISILLVPKPKNNYKVGVGYGTDTGPRLVAGWDVRYLNRRGQKLETNLKGSTTLNMLSVKHITPDFRRTGTELDLLSSISREDTDTHLSNTFVFGMQQIQKRWNWNETLSLSYQLENFDVAGDERNSNLLIPAVSYWKSVSDSPIYTDKGYKLNLILKGSMRGALSDLGFIQSTMSGKHIMSLFGQGRLITRGELGATYVDNFDRLPASIRYFAGGDNNIRGFDIQAQGPRNSNGEVIGGRYLAVGSIEFEHPIYKQISAAIFTDFGNAFNSLSDHFVYSVGAGLRWLTPVGMVRLDLGFGISEEPGTFRLHFNLGPDL
ncbi:MAG: translocation and assembly module TamA [Gammaproteobacteria bacterium]